MFEKDGASMKKIEGDGVLDLIFCHDDRLVFRGQKHEIGLDADWKKAIPRNGDIYGYHQAKFPTEYDKKGNKVFLHISVSEYEAMDVANQMQWQETRSRTCTLENGIVLHGEGSFLDIRMLDLWENFNSRYRSSLDAVVEAVDRGIVGYKPQGTTRAVQRVRTAQEKKTEAMRNRFRDRFHAVAYEHNVILPADIGAVLLKELEPQDMAGGRYSGTVYTKGFKGKESILVRVYDMNELHGIDSVKIEVVLRQDYLERHEMLDPAKWETQPEIQEKIKSTLEKEWRILFKEARGAWKMLAERVQTPQAELFSFMVSTKNTFTEVKARLDAVERRLEKLEETERKRERAGQQ